jgi:hypothetical protein
VDDVLVTSGACEPANPEGAPRLEVSCRSLAGLRPGIGEREDWRQASASTQMKGIAGH